LATPFGRIAQMVAALAAPATGKEGGVPLCLSRHDRRTYAISDRVSADLS
jgi:hypothetical protein